MASNGTGPSNRRAALGAVILVLAFIASRLLGLVREMVIAAVFGASPAIDAYVAAFRLPDFIFQLLASGAFGSAFIPVFVRYMTHGRAADAWKITNAALSLVAVASTVLAILMAAAAPVIVPLLFPGFVDPDTQRLVVDLTRMMLLTPIFFGLSSIVTAVLNARQHFLIPAIAPLIYNLAIIASAVLFGESIGVYGLALGVVVGSALHFLLQLPELVRHGLSYRPTVGLHHPGVREVGRLLLPRALGLAAAQVNFLVYAFIASGLAPGSLAAVNWAWQLMMLPVGVFGITIATAVFPTLADQAALDDLDSLRRTISGSLRVVLFLMIPASIGLIVLREPVVALLFQRGKFGVESTQLTAWALLFFALGLFAHGMIEILTRGFYALHDTRTPVIFSCTTMLMNIVLAPLFVGFFSHGGLGLAMSVAVTFEAMALLTLLRNRVGGLDEDRIAASVIRTLVASLTMGILLIGLETGLRTWAGSSSMQSPLMTLGAVALGGLIYVLAAGALRAEEIVLLLSVVRRPSSGRRAGAARAARLRR